MIFEWGQRASPTGKFDEGTPEGSRQVNPGHPGPAQNKQTTCNNKSNKQEVKHNHRISK